MAQSSKDNDQYSDEEIARRFKGGLKRMLSTPHKPQEPIGKKKASEEKHGQPPEKANSVRPDAISDIADLCRMLAPVADSEWATLITLPPGYFFDEARKRRKIVVLPRRVTKPRELVQVRIDLFDANSALDIFYAAIRHELEPFIEGIGRVRVHKDAKGIVVMG